jgi:hypothetical protein
MVPALDAHLARAFDLAFEIGFLVRGRQTPWLETGEKEEEGSQPVAGARRSFHAGIDF